MIVSNFKDYKNARLPEKIEKAVDEILLLLENPLENGKHPLSNNAKALIDHYTTNPEEKVLYESHVEMTDIHIVLDGEEYVKYTPLSHLTKLSDPQEIKAFREDLPINVEDLQFYKEQIKEESLIHLSKEKANFCVFFPHEAHCASIMLDQPKKIRKLVIKIPL